MTLMLKKEGVFLQCPFCNKGKFRAVYIPQMVKERKGSWGGQVGRKTIPSKTQVISKCDNCGKSVKELQKALDGKSTELNKKKDKKIIERMKKQGLDLEFLTTKF